MRLLMLTNGSHGDIHPFLAIGRAMIGRGHAAALMTNPYFAPHTSEAGLEHFALGEHKDLGKMLSENPATMSGLRGPMQVLRKLMLPHVPEIIENTRRAINDWKADAVLVHPLCIGASWAAELAGVPCHAASLAPSIWFNAKDQAVLPPFRSENPSRRAVKLDMFMARLVTSLALDGPLNAQRNAMRLPKMKSIFITEARGGLTNLALWSPLFRPIIDGDPPGAKITGFPWYDRAKEQEAPSDVVEKFMKDGEPPLVFTLGTAAAHTAGRFHQHAARACEILKRRGLFLVGRGHQGPPNMPKRSAAFEYAPFSAVFQHAAVNIHHGGIGTTAQALRAGRPTVVIPMAHDQFDNAARLKRMRVSDTVRHAQVTPERLASAIRRVLEDPTIANTAAKFAPLIAREDGAAVAADILAGERR